LAKNVFTGEQSPQENGRGSELETKEENETAVLLAGVTIFKFQTETLM
jgi:hypothetical protein